MTRLRCKSSRGRAHEAILGEWLPGTGLRWFQTAQSGGNRHKGKKGGSPCDTGGHDPQPGFLPEVRPCVHEATTWQTQGPSLGGPGVLCYVQKIPLRGYRRRGEHRALPALVTTTCCIYALVNNMKGITWNSFWSLRAPAHHHSHSSDEPACLPVAYYMLVGARGSACVAPYSSQEGLPQSQLATTSLVSQHLVRKGPPG